MLTLRPTSAFSSVDLPTLGRPTSAIKPARKPSASMTDFLEKTLCGGLLGAAAAGAFGARLELQRRYAAGHLEYLPVGGTADRQGFVLGQAESPLLQQFLQARLWILQRARIRQAGEQLPEGGMDEFRGGLDAAVEIDGADDRFQRSRQHRAAAKAAGFQFAGAEPQHVADLQRLRDVRQRLAVHQRGAQPGEIAFVVADIAAEKKIGDHHAEHGVAEKF